MNQMQRPPDPTNLFERLEQLNQIGVALSKETDINRLLEAILVAAQKITHADGGTLYRMTEERTLKFEIMRNDTLGIAMGGTARQFVVDDFARFDLVMAMDSDNAAALRALAPDDDARAKVRLLREFDPQAHGDLDVPDPYFGGSEGFVDVFDMVDRSITGLIAHIGTTHPAG